MLDTSACLCKVPLSQGSLICCHLSDATGQLLHDAMHTESLSMTAMWVAQVLDKQKPGKREKVNSCKFPMVESGNHDDPGWESEVRSREEELSKYEGSILAREFKDRLAYNMGQVLLSAQPSTLQCSSMLQRPFLASLATCRSALRRLVPAPQCQDARHCIQWRMCRASVPVVSTEIERQQY